jgi:hypothetical protein
MDPKEHKALSDALGEWRWICRLRYSDQQNPRLLLWVNMNHGYLLWRADLAS